MSELLKCPNCGGCKVILGVGGMKKDCDVCKTVGWIKNTESTVASTAISPSEIDQLKADLNCMINKYEKLQSENEDLKKQMQSMPQSKSKKGRKAKGSTGNTKSFSPAMMQLSY